MKKILLMLGLIAFAAPGLLATSAQAQATRTWISGVGDDVNPCSRTAPCKTFAGAISKTAAGGEIDTLDPGGFGAVTVTKAITLANEGIGEAGILVAGTNGVTVNCATDPTCVVILRGLQIDGGPIGSNSLNGVRFVAGRALEIQNCAIRNFTGGSPNGYAVSFQPSASQGEELDISDTSLSTNGQSGGGGSIGGGVLIQPTGTPAVKATLERVQMYANTNGINLDTSLATGGNATVSADNVVVQGSQSQGVQINTGTGGTASRLFVSHSVIANNGTRGFNLHGATATAYIDDDVITNNNVAFNISNGGVINSFGRNTIAGNTTDATNLLTSVTPF